MNTTQAITLFVDDAPSLLEIIKSRLAEIGYRAVEIASNVEEALKIMSNRQVEHIVSDWHMENPGGVAFLKEVRNSNPSIRCTLLTGFVKDLSEGDLSLMTSMNIAVEDKEQVSTAWLARLVGVKNYIPAPLEIDEEIEMTGQDLVSGPADIIAQQRLKLEELEKIILHFAQDLLQEIECVTISKKDQAIIGGRSHYEIKDLVREIRLLTPLGRRLIELDRAARQRMFRQRTGAGE